MRMRSFQRSTLRAGTFSGGPGMYSGFWDINGDETDAISEATYNWDFNGNGTKTDMEELKRLVGADIGVEIRSRDWYAER